MMEICSLKWCSSQVPEMQEDIFASSCTALHLLNTHNTIVNTKNWLLLKIVRKYSFVIKLKFLGLFEKLSWQKQNLNTDGFSSVIICESGFTKFGSNLPSFNGWYSLLWGKTTESLISDITLLQILTTHLGPSISSCTGFSTWYLGPSCVPWPGQDWLFCTTEGMMIS